MRKLNHKIKNNFGYEFIYTPDHPNSNGKGFFAVHRLIVEGVIGRYLKKTEVVHHFDEIPGNNKKDNLVACENENYHRIIHQRLRAYKSCGHANWKKCYICKEYDAPSKIKTPAGRNRSGFHPECRKNFYRKRAKENGIDPEISKKMWSQDGRRPGFKNGVYYNRHSKKWIGIN